MKLRVTEAFKREARDYRLLYRCEDCVFYDGNPSRDDTEGRCSHGYPTLEHRRRLEADPDAALVFCKEFSSY